MCVHVCVRVFLHVVYGGCVGVCADVCGCLWVYVCGVYGVRVVCGVFSRSGKRHETCDESLSISETLSKYDLSLPLHPPTTGPIVGYAAGCTKTVAGECTAGVRYTSTMDISIVT